MRATIALVLLQLLVGPAAQADVLTGKERGLWISNLHAHGGAGHAQLVCCQDSDAEEDVYWESKDGRYLVFVLGEWLDVPDWALVLEPNRIGVAKLWLQNASHDGTGKLTSHSGVRCFLPGAAY